ncbi:protein piccolo-like isoform X9 [Crassostrea angulata]|uniref:protein piccolo-like isoform X9 n=1 Tax=Magallana angulata TaxID=2784310 RepID=UPI0022B178ED|nr:protein piccolo-like isoform X9 [Crassostrea angulata]
MIMTQPKSCLRRTETSLSRYSDDVFSVTITPRGTPTSFRRSESSFALLKRSQPSSSLQFPKVEATNVNRDDKLKLSRLGQRIRRDPHRAISIDESPIMLLPKANVRNDYDIRASKRAFNVVADDELSTFHLSTVPLDREEIKSSRSVSRSSMKSRKSLQSETDSGFGSSLRRCVTFSELSLSRSTIARSLDDIEKSSELEDVNNNNLKNINMLDSLFGPLPETEDDGGHLDSFADVIPDPPKIRKKQKDNAEVEDQRCTLTETDVKRCHEQDCEICKGFASEHTRIQRYFGGVDQFLQWLYSKWGKKRTELLTYSRANYLSRGNRPKFCDIVRQKELHYRDEEDRSESSEYNYYRQQGHLLTRWRKHSNARPKNSRKSSLAQEDLVDQNVNDTAPFQRQGVNQSNLSTLWMLGKEGRGGTEGRPGSPTSTVDGTDNQPDPPKEEESEPMVETKPDIITPSVIDIPDSKSDISSSSAQPQLTSVDIRVIITGKPSTKTDSKDDKKKTEPISVPSDRDGRQSPVQPPPSPEPLTPKEDPNKDAALLKSLREAEEEEERRRRALVKKEKKPIHRTRKPKEEMEEKVEPPKPATPPPPPQPIEDTVTLVQQWKNKDIKVDLEVPSLPTFEDKKKDKKEKRKAERHLVSQPKHETPPPKDPEPLVLRTPLEFPKEEEVDLDDLDDQLKQRLKNFDFNIMEMMGEDSPRKNVQKATWVTGRLALSQQSSRFTLPIDMARLEQMTPLDYVKNFCIIKRRRKKLYQDIFVKHKDKTGQIPFKDLEKALTMVLVNTLTSDDYKRIVELLDISDSTRVDVDGFSAMAALAERLMCSTHVSQEQVDQPDYQKEKIECADFSALEWKLTGVQVNPKIVRILKELN